MDGKTPYEILHGSPPVYDLLCVFGCLAYAHRRARDKDKFGERSRKCLFVGYPFGKKAWKLYDLETNEFFVSRDVTFLEDQFPGMPDTEYVSPPILQNNLMDDWLLPTLQSRGSTSGLDQPASATAEQPQVPAPPPPITTDLSPHTEPE